MIPARATGPRQNQQQTFLTIGVLTLWMTTVSLSGCATLGPDSRQVQEDPKPRQIQASFLSAPLSFEANQGQTDSQVKFLSRGPGYGLFLTPTEMVLALRKAKPTQADAATDETPSESAVLRMRLVGANPTPELSGETALPGKVNYFIGNDHTKWRTHVPTYAQARYANVYPGIDLVYYGNQRQLEYDFVVAPGQEPANITMAFQGMERLELDVTGDLVLQTSGGEVRQRKPVIYQEVAGERKAIDGSYLLKNDDQVGFQVAAYDTTKPLIIDPILVFSTYLGGTNFDQGQGIAVDDAGQIYVTGVTSSLDFPTRNAFQPTFGGPFVDAFVIQLTADGSSLNYATYLGGDSSEVGEGIAVDSAGQAYVTGRTSSTDFPTMNPLQPALAGLGNAFVAQLSADGTALVYSTYLGGSNRLGDGGSDIAVDGAGQAYVTGRTSSTDFPTMNPLQPALAGFQDAFVAQLSADGTALVYSTYLGGSDPNPEGEGDIGLGIAVDDAGRASVTGTTESADFPRMNAVQPIYGGGLNDAFVAQLTADGSALVYATYLGGANDDGGKGIAVDGAGQVSVTGQTRSPDFPTQNPLQPALVGGADAFVAQLTPDGSALNFSTYLGGSSLETGWGIAVDGAGRASVMGSTSSTDFPTQNPLQPANAGGSDAFVAQLSADGAALNFSTYLGGSDLDSGRGIALDGVGQVSVTGVTSSLDFPTRNAFQPTFGGGLNDAFVAKFAPDPDFVTIDGCETGVPNKLVDDQHTISDLILQCAAGTRNHGQFVRCVAQLSNGLKKAGMISGKDKGAIMRCAGQAAIP